MLLFAMPPGLASAAEAESSVTKPEEAVIFFRHLYGTSKDVFGPVRRCGSDICDKDRIYLERSAESRSQEQLDIALNECESNQGVGIVTMENPVFCVRDVVPGTAYALRVTCSKYIRFHCFKPQVDLDL
ncbi:MAG: hypothetical protein JNM39_17645 [Bdellovibrionaceae bacterium]|nr:hypothetical protein [Pseudobdellovibrionaceae bacterium]